MLAHRGGMMTYLSAAEVLLKHYFDAVGSFRGHLADPW